ncbi:hypothetical protein KC19_VG185600 [Ceratodon purpureus]|uniref:Uncharacterized protein n=1 Tax=Ceratodon purpureus TaxID=3225 RepID=A0A8T0HRB7_CERPU|nr:hypothetical protein KC19_VG185600 [Ceratodon purpureus]
MRLRNWRGRKTPRPKQKAIPREPIPWPLVSECPVGQLRDSPQPHHAHHRRPTKLRCEHLPITLHQRRHTFTSSSHHASKILTLRRPQHQNLKDPKKDRISYFSYLRVLARYFSPCTASLSFGRIFGTKKLTKSRQKVDKVKKYDRIDKNTKNNVEVIILDISL